MRARRAQIRSAVFAGEIGAKVVISDPQTGRKTDIVLIGVHASRNPFRIPEVLSRQDSLASPEAVLFDEGSFLFHTSEHPQRADFAGTGAFVGFIQDTQL